TGQAGGRRRTPPPGGGRQGPRGGGRPAWLPPTSAGGLFRRHAQGAVEANNFPVEHPVIEDVPDERGELCGLSEPLWVGNLGGERVLYLRAEPAEHGGAERAGRYRHHPDGIARELAGGR